MAHKLKIVEVPPTARPIRKSPGFHKKMLSEYALDLLGKCGFGCAYCSSNTGNYLRINRKRFADLTQEQTGERTYPASDPYLMFVWPKTLERLEAQVRRSRMGSGKTLVFSMLTDAFSPRLVGAGTTRRALELVVEHTDFRIRVLTKNACVGSPPWRRFFAQHPHRFVVGLSIGHTDDAWAKRVEIGTSPPSHRLKALRRLQDAGVPTYGMLCPVFPDALVGERLETLVQSIRPELCEHVWAEPYNDRSNWRRVQAGFEPGSRSHQTLSRLFDSSSDAAWSRYATDLYLRLRQVAEDDGWLSKLRYLLYEGKVTPGDAGEFAGLHGVVLQGRPGPRGFSTHSVFATHQRGGVPPGHRTAPSSWTPPHLCEAARAQS